MLQQKIAFIGAGNMAEAFCRGLIRQKLADPAQLMASDPRPEVAWPAGLGLRLTASNQEARDFGQVIVLSVKPNQALSVLKEMAGGLAGKLVVSICAGMRLGSLESADPLLQRDKVAFVRVMPNTPALVGLGASAYCLGRHAGEAQASLVESILGALGVFVRVAEADMDAVTALSGSGPAYVFLFMEALQAAGRQAGLPEDVSFKLAAQTLKGAAEMVSQGISSPAALREKVTSPGGTTAAALQVFESAGFRGIVEKAVSAAKSRSIELGAGAK